MKLRRLALVLSVWTCAHASAHAATPEIESWLDMAQICEALVFDQDNTALDGYRPAAPLINVTGLAETAIAHPSTPLIASAVSASGRWVMCIIAAQPPRDANKAGALIGSWAAAQAQLSQAPDNHMMAFEDVSTFAPVRMRCGDGHMAVIMAFAHDSSSFRLSVTDRLPGSMPSPYPG
ncbi:MAG: hypothetical protein HRU31_14390 [Rhodobacteraceae bacterium]|nr:hypothetical protein [Paracoccaceae bacterium]